MSLDGADPRQQDISETDLHPVVARRSVDRPIWLVPGAIILSGLVLFGVLETQRQARALPTTNIRTVDRVQMPSALPPLFIPVEQQNLEPPPPPPPPPPSVIIAPSSPLLSEPLPPSLSLIGSNRPVQTGLLPSSFPASSVAINAPRATSNAETLVIDTTRSERDTNPTATRQPPRSEGSEASSGNEDEAATGSVRAMPTGRRATTVPQGTLIPAVLETALDSTRPGYVRALVTRDVTGFDGTRILIPRGSRLIGDYKADLSPGQNRAVVQWTRLVRPDGVSIALDSPAADRLGRSGIGGRVDSHFLARFGSAILQTTLNFGAGLARQSLSSDTAVVVALPGSTQGLSPSTTGTQIQPTLRVNAGSTVTVFVARDLEFPTGVRK